MGRGRAKRRVRVLASIGGIVTGNSVAADQTVSLGATNFVGKHRMSLVGFCCSGCLFIFVLFCFVCFVLFAYIFVLFVFFLFFVLFV